MKGQKDVKSKVQLMGQEEIKCGDFSNLPPSEAWKPLIINMSNFGQEQSKVSRENICHFERNFRILSLYSYNAKATYNLNILFHIQIILTYISIS